MAQRGGKRPGAGRPKGVRNKLTRDAQKTITELAREQTDAALQALVSIAKEGESEAARVSAANSLLDRAYGKPSQSHELSGPGGEPIELDLRKLSDEELSALERILGPLAGSGANDEGDPGGAGEAGG